MTDKGLSTCDELSEMMKQVSLGGHSFANMREKDRYYVDKTLLIKDLVDAEDDGVFLYTRPRRFGKTTNLSMLDAFFNEKYKGNTWFDGLEISKYPEYEKFKNAFPVIHLNLNDTKASTYESFINMMRTAVRNAYNAHEYLLKDPNVDPDFADMFRSVKRREIIEDFLKTSLSDLSEAIFRFSGKKPIILIDEYDRAVSDNFGEESHRKILDFLGGFLCSALKTNGNRGIVYMTGILQIAKESIFSSLNNVTVNNVFSVDSDERFGFTETEVKGILDYYGCSDKFDLAKKWYDGYRFGDAEVYNPYSIMRFVSAKCRESAYWVDSGKDVLIKDMLKSITIDTYADIMSLATGGSIRSNLIATFPYESIKRSGKPLYSLMAMSGYLKAVPVGDSFVYGTGPYMLSIPNEEVRRVVEDMMETVYPLDTSDFSAFCQAILDEDAKGMEKVLVRVMNGASYINLNEATYAAVIMTLTHSLSKTYRVKLEVPEGKGRVDIEFYPKVADIPPMIFELKVTDEEKDLDAKVAEAFAQIHDREYYNGMEGRIILVGMAFWNKVPKIEIGSVMNGDGFILSDEKAGRV